MVNEQGSLAVKLVEVGQNHCTWDAAQGSSLTVALCYVSAYILQEINK